MSTEPEAFVLIRWSDIRHVQPDDVVVMGVYSSMDGVVARMAKVAKANPQYDTIRTSEYAWQTGPGEDEDEGFFGNKPMLFAVKRVPMRNVSIATPEATP